MRSRLIISLMNRFGHKRAEITITGYRKYRFCIITRTGFILTLKQANRGKKTSSSSSSFSEQRAPVADVTSFLLLIKFLQLLKKMQSEESHDLANEVSKEKMKSQKADRKKMKLKEKLLKEATTADNRGVCYLSRIPPHMDHVRLRQILSQYGELGRIYLAPEDPEAQVHRKRAGGFRGQLFSEGWVEFSKKTVAKRVADMLNGEQIGGKKKSSVYYDIWNIKYLTKFKWDDLTEEIAYKSAIREQKSNMVLSAAKREKDFYLSKVEKSRAMTEIDARMKKKQKIQEESGSNAEAAPVFPPRVIRQFRQKKSVNNEISESKPGLSTDVLASVFGGP